MLVRAKATIVPYRHKTTRSTRATDCRRTRRAIALPAIVSSTRERPACDPVRGNGMSLDIASLFAERQAERYSLHTTHLNEQMVRVLKTIGFDVGFVRGQGQYLYDRNGDRYLDL